MGKIIFELILLGFCLGEDYIFLSVPDLFLKCRCWPFCFNHNESNFKCVADHPKMFTLVLEADPHLGVPWNRVSTKWLV